LPALRQQEYRAALVRFLYRHVEEERLTRNRLVSKERPHGLLQASLMVDRPQDIEDKEAMKFFGGEEGDADLSRG
jgi:hypothetical protein